MTGSVTVSVKFYSETESFTACPDAEGMLWRWAGRVPDGYIYYNTPDGHVMINTDHAQLITVREDGAS